MDARKPRDGKAIEELGHYDPLLPDKAQRVQLKMERIDYWLSVGAQPSENVAALIKKVRTNRFGTAAAPPPMTAPKAPPEPEPAAEETATEETAADEQTADETPAETPAENTDEASAESAEKS